MLVRKRIPLLPLGCQRVPTKGKEGSPRIEFLHIMLNCVVNLLLPFIFHVLVFLALCTKIKFVSKTNKRETKTCSK